MLHVRYVLQYISLTMSVTQQREISKFKVWTTTSTHNNYSFILFICFDGGLISHLEAHFINNVEREQGIIATWSRLRESLYSTEVFAPEAVVA